MNSTLKILSLAAVILASAAVWAQESSQASAAPIHETEFSIRIAEARKQAVRLLRRASQNHAETAELNFSALADILEKVAIVPANESEIKSCQRSARAFVSPTARGITLCPEIYSGEHYYRNELARVLIHESTHVSRLIADAMTNNMTNAAQNPVFQSPELGSPSDECSAEDSTFAAFAAANEYLPDISSYVVTLPCKEIFNKTTEVRREEDARSELVELLEHLKNSIQPMEVSKVLFDQVQKAYASSTTPFHLDGADKRTHSDDQDALLLEHADFKHPALVFWKAYDVVTVWPMNSDDFKRLKLDLEIKEKPAAN